MAFVPVCKADPVGLSSRPDVTRVEKDCLPDPGVVSDTSRFRRCNRLNKPAEFQTLFASGKRTGNRELLFISRQNNTDHARLGLAISKKNVPLAVNRNRLKRLIRESFRLHQQQLKGMDIVVLAKKQFSNANDRALFGALEKHWNKLT